MRDMFQSHMRVRNVKDNIMVYCVDERHNGVRIGELCVDSKQISETLSWKEEQYKRPEHGGDTYLEVSKVMRSVYVENILERNQSISQLCDVFRYYLEISGYKGMNGGVVDDGLDDEAIKELLKPVKIEVVPYDTIKELLYSEVEVLKRKPNLSKDEDLSLQKFYFQALLVKEEKDCNASQLWELFCDYGRQKFTMMSLIKGCLKEQLTTKDIFGRDTNTLFNSGTSLKIEALSRMLKILDCDYSQLPKSYTSAQFEVISKEIDTIAGILRKSFEIRDQTKDEAGSTTRNVKLINAINDRSSYLKLSRERHRERVDGKQREVGKYVLSEVQTVMKYIKPKEVSRIATHEGVNPLCT